MPSEEPASLNSSLDPFWISNFMSLIKDLLELIFSAREIISAEDLLTSVPICQIELS